MTKGRTLLTCGEHAVLVEVAGLDEVLALTQDIREAIAGNQRDSPTSSTLSRLPGPCWSLFVTMPRWVLSGKPCRLCRTLSLANSRAAARL